MDEKITININYRKVLLVLCDIVAIQIASFLSLIVRFDFAVSRIPGNYLSEVTRYAPINTLLTVIVFALFKLYRSVWRLASTRELLNIIGGSFAAAVLQVCVMHVMQVNVPRSFHVLFLGIIAAELVCSRFSYRFLRIMKNRYLAATDKDVKRVMLIGAGQAGEMLLKDLEKGEVHEKVVCIVDDNKSIWGKYLRGKEIVGGHENIPNFASRYNIDEIIVAIPSASGAAMRDILKYCKETDCELRTLPGMYQLVTGEVSVSKLRKVSIADLLGREEVGTQIDTIMEYVAGKTVLVTGGGGSIGSELCRQIAAHEPKKLIILDIYENNAYDIQMELKRHYNILDGTTKAETGKPLLDMEVVIASVRDAERIDQIFDKYRPDLVFHAAAHKHVPLMEDSPNEAVKNNVFGTLNVARAADRYEVQRFVLISTDKAVNPTNIMGATKRICEMIVQLINEESETEFVAVRFGNVLGSNGSVIPLFKKQIEEGGPVTVTHPEIIRYFMTIPEAVSLVLQAGANAKGGEIFVLDMGEPVKIVDLARNMIRLSGYTLDEIPIKYVGLRPGEKMYEEKLMEEEGLAKTENELIFIGKPLVFDHEEFKQKIKNLGEMMEDDSSEIKEAVAEIVGTYRFQ
ncbi:MAG: polysaccharide biosynthesis protein [Lachnospiraceae bacterium]|nr:polysaccharide biosynthesis protein [Lachnospiraceae bacterium]